jgi:CBS domain-containing protein
MKIAEDLVHDKNRAIVSVPATMTVGDAVALMARENVGCKDGRHIGLISAGDIMKASIREKDQELAHANAEMSWEYYEEWRWK